MGAGDASRLWCNIADDSELGGVLEMLSHLEARCPALSVVLTAGRSVAFSDALPDFASVSPKPYDLPAIVDRFVEDKRPRAALFTGTDLFPSAQAACRRIGVPTALANACFRERWKLHERLADLRLGARLRTFDRIFAVEQEDAEFLVRKGVTRSRVAVTGRLEAVPEALPCDDSEREYLSKRVATRPVWLAASLPEAEFGAVEAAFRVANRQAHRLLLIVTPSGPEVAEAAEHFFEAAGWVTARRENAQEPTEQVQVYIADAPDEAGMWYRLAPITYLGGTMSGGTTPDPFHPAALGSAVMHGLDIPMPVPWLSRLTASGACRSVASAEDLGVAVTDLLAPDRAAALANRGWDVTSRGAEAAERVAGEVALLLNGAGA